MYYIEETCRGAVLRADDHDCDVELFDIRDDTRAEHWLRKARLCLAEAAPRLEHIDDPRERVKVARELLESARLCLPEWLSTWLGWQCEFAMAAEDVSFHRQELEEEERRREREDLRESIREDFYAMTGTRLL